MAFSGSGGPGGRSISSVPNSDSFVEVASSLVMPSSAEIHSPVAVSKCPFSRGHIVRNQFGFVLGATDLDVATILCGQVRMARFHCCDHVVASASSATACCT